MNKPLVLSLSLIALLSSNLNAQSMLERFEAMEREMDSLKQQIAELKKQKYISEKSEKTDDDEILIISTTDSEEEDEEENDDEDIATDEERISDLEETVSEIARNTSGSHLKFKVDYRFAVENINYKMAAKDASGKDSHTNDAFMTNRLWIGMGYQATNNLSFSAQLAYNKAFGARSGASNPMTNQFEAFDWIASENAFDDQLRVRSAYFFYKDTELFGLDIPWTFSVGRRPSTGGHLISLRDDDNPSSPMGHAINVEFDGLSSKFTLYKDWGTYVKFCAGRGMSNATPKFTSTPYAQDSMDNTNIDLAGFIFTPYDDKQYSISTQYYYASNLIDMRDTTLTNQMLGLETVGGMHSFTSNLSIHGIGDEWSDFLDDTTFFISGAMSKTDPDKNHGMLGSANGESKTGYSYWIGTQFPSLLSEDGRWGFEFNHGSQYWRSITYGEDTSIGSKVATRGNVYEAYFTEYLIEDILSMQIRYTYADYDYTGSNGFFGNTSGASYSIDQLKKAAAAGNTQAQSMLPNIVENAQDIRFYLRYRY